MDANVVASIEVPQGRLTPEEQARSLADSLRAFQTSNLGVRRGPIQIGSPERIGRSSLGAVTTVIAQASDESLWSDLAVPIALLALLLSAISLGFSGYTWWMKGPRIRVEARYGGVYMGTERGGRHSALRVTVENRGRGAVQVYSWWIMSRHKRLGGEPLGVAGGSDGPDDDPLPTTLEGHHRASWTRSLVDTSHPPLDDLLGDEIRVEVRLGGRKPVHTNWMAFPPRSQRLSSHEIAEAMGMRRPPELD